MLQVFHLDAVQVDLDVAYVCNGYQRMLQVYVIIFFIYFGRML
jgi:hypothetical protein